MNSIGCWICHREFPSVEEYIRHMCCRPTVENNSTLYSCQICNNGFPSALSFGNHMCRRKKTDNQENSTSHSTQKRKTPDNEENNLPQMKKKRVGGKSCNEDSMGKLDNEEDKTTKKKEGNMKNGNQVGRGRRDSLGSRAQIETFKPQNTQDLLREIKEQETPIRDHLIDRLHKLMKWYIVVYAEFKRDIPTGGTCARL